MTANPSTRAQSLDSQSASQQTEQPAGPQAAVRSRKRPVACDRCHAQKIKCSGESPCSRCRRVGCGDQCRYVSRDRKIRVDESFLEQLIKDSEELRALRGSLSINAATNHISSGSQTTIDIGGSTNSNGVTHTSQPYDGSDFPIRTSDAACTAFASRLCQYLRNSDTPIHTLPRWIYIEESALTSLLEQGVQWPSLVYAQLLVKTALGHINPAFHLVLRKETLDTLASIYEKGLFDDSALKCKYFALFALGQVFSTPRTPSFSDSPSPLPGSAFFAHASSLVQFLPEWPDMIHIEGLLCLSFFCQFLNRFHSAYALVGNAMRLALSLGMNHHSAESQSPNSMEQQHRIRVWWTIYILDRFWGAKLGFPMQIDDKDIQLDHPSETISQIHHDQFPDGVFQTVTIGLARIAGNIVREIYSLRKSAASFLQREQSLLIQLRQWVRSLPDNLKLYPDWPNPKHIVLAHLQFNYCLILAIRPVLLHILRTKNDVHLPSSSFSSARIISPIATTLSEACIHAARNTITLCEEEWISGAIAVYGYAFPAYIFSSAVILLVAGVLSLGNPGDTASTDTAMEILRVLSLSDNITAKNLYEHLREVRQCLLSMNTAADSISALTNDRVHREAGLSSTTVVEDSGQWAGDTHLQTPQSPTTFDPASVHVSSYLTTDMLISEPTIQAFLDQSCMEMDLFLSEGIHEE